MDPRRIFLIKGENEEAVFSEGKDKAGFYSCSATTAGFSAAA